MKNALAMLRKSCETVGKCEEPTSDSAGDGESLIPARKEILLTFAATVGAGTVVVGPLVAVRNGHRVCSAIPTIEALGE